MSVANVTQRASLVNQWSRICIQCRKCEFSPWSRKIHAMGKEMATYSSILAWENPWTEELGRLKVHGGHKSVRHNLATEKQELHIVNKLLINLGTFFLIFCWVPTYNTYINSSLSHWYVTLRISHFLSQNISCPSWNSTVFSSSFSHHFIVSPWGTIPAFCDPTTLWIPSFLLCPAIAILPTV